jgi:hypothetical protein
MVFQATFAAQGEVGSAAWVFGLLFVSGLKCCPKL